MLIYAWQRLDSANIVNISQLESCTNAVSLLARILINCLNKILKQGLDRDYKSNTQPLQAIKGKVQFQKSFFHYATGKLALECEFEQLSYDVLHNQIIKTTLGNLLKLPPTLLSGEYRSQVQKIYQNLRQITKINLSKSHFDLIQLHSNNGTYALLLDICKLIFDSLLPSEEPGEIIFKDFIKDERKMSKLFEDFLRNFYRLNQSKYAVSSRKLSFNPEINNEIIPDMETDILLESKDKAIIIDAKFYKSALKQNRFGNRKISNSHIYQLNAYLRAYDQKHNCKPIGILIYPTVNENINSQEKILDYQQHYYTLDLSKNWDAISNQLLNIIKQN